MLCTDIALAGVKGTQLSTKDTNAFQKDLVTKLYSISTKITTVKATTISVKAKKQWPLNIIGIWNKDFLHNQPT